MGLTGYDYKHLSFSVLIQLFEAKKDTVEKHTTDMYIKLHANEIDGLE